ncbi:PD-(D/E)XK nuclease family protein [Psychroserpens sp. BH13MA-6]
MISFIDEVLKDLVGKSYTLSQLTFVLPSKRSGTFLKHAISKHVNDTIFSPNILSIEEFVETISEFQYTSNSELLFDFYDVYLKNTPEKDLESFDKFSKWAQVLLQDFNEIDRYLIPPDDIFDYLNAIKEIEHWSLDEQPTTYIKNYLQFWNRLKFYYTEFKKHLKVQKKGYQGLVYREAVDNIEQYLSLNTHETFIFVGFNALNKAENVIIQEILAQDLGLIYWDIDEVFINNDVHDAGLFLRAHRKEWTYFSKHDFNWIGNNYSQPKDIQIIGAPKNISQIKYVGELLETIAKKEKNLQNTAVVLGDETLLLPLLNSIPKAIGAVNITMGLPLKVIPLASLFESLFNIHKSSKTLYYKDVIGVLSNQYVSQLFQQTTGNISDNLISYIQENNKVYLQSSELKALAIEHKEVIGLLFDSWQDSSSKAITCCTQLILKIKSQLDQDKSDQLLSLEYLYRFHEIFNTLAKLNASFSHINSVTTLFTLYRELIKNDTLDFKGEPLKGLQIMGMLESRVLDFETVIITSVNEGILPAGKSHNSFIPFDVKLQNDLPTYKEKDAVYTYHFYRLIQRSKSAYILYNTEPDVLNGGEKSRFITQLEVEGIHTINHQIVSAKVPVINTQLKTIKKSKDIIKTLDDLAQKGFSPSSLTNYVRNPMDFYYEKILGIKQYDDVEESVAFNTLGTIIHNTLEDFYKPVVGEFLTEGVVNTMIKNIKKIVTHHFKIEYKDGDFTNGKNLLIYEIAQRYVANFLRLELKTLKNGNQIKILAIETKNDVSLNIDEISKTVNLTGKVDRIDEYNGTLRIIDYKTGKVEAGKVEIVDWDDITTDYTKYSKSFQILMYAYMMFKSNQITLPVEAGIISFKNLNSGFLKFAIKPSIKSRTKNHTIDEAVLLAFENQLKKLIIEIYDVNLDFEEKEV